MTAHRPVSPALALFFLSPMIGELLSGSSPPAEFFNPVTLVVLCVLYGGGAIIVRELAFRWGKGWPTILTLGAAYGIIEEGLAVKSFFDPKWVDIGILGSYGRWAGINWVWVLHLTIYHAVFSISIPILLVTLIFRDRDSESWVSRRGFKILAVLVAVEVLLLFLFITKYRPPVVPYFLTIAGVVGLYELAWRLPSRLPQAKSEQQSVPRPRRFALVGFLATVALFLGGWVLPHTRIPPIGTMLLMAGVVLLTARTILRMSGGGSGWTDLHRLALASGALAFFILLAPLQELDKNRQDIRTGMSLVGLAAALFLLWLARRLRPGSGRCA